jgi:uncharacterized protein (DUF58 family)
MRRIASSVTTRARCLLAGGLTAAVLGLVLGSTDLLRAGCLILVVPLVAYLVVSRSQVTIASRRSVEPARTSVGHDVGMQLTITNRSALPVGGLMLEDRLPDQLVGRVRFSLEGLRGREARTIAYQLPTPRRGRYLCGPLKVRLTDPFGLIELTRSFTAQSRFVVTPAVELMPDARTPNSIDVGDNAGSHSIGSHGADDASTREYRDGDDLRKIHWRSTARTGTLMVRHEERPRQSQVALLLDLRASAHEQPIAPAMAGDPREASSLEWAVSAVASIGNELLLARREVTLIASSAADQRLAFGSSAEFVDHLADVAPNSQRDLTPLIPALRIAARECTVVAVLGTLEETSLQAIADARPRGSSAPAFAILIDQSSWARQRVSTALDDIRPAPRETAAVTTEKIADTLRGAGWWVAIARAGDAIPATWTRLLRQRAFAISQAESVAPEATRWRVRT